jgi:hypothetical protein
MSFNIETKRIFLLVRWLSLWRKRSVQLHINKSSSHRAATVQYFDIDLFSLDLLFNHQRVYINLPDLLYYSYEQNKAPEIIVIKLYSNTNSEIYLISMLNRSRERPKWSKKNPLFQMKEGNIRILKFCGWMVFMYLW